MLEGENLKTLYTQWESQKKNITWFENDNSWSHEIEEFFDAVSGKKNIQSGTSKEAYDVLKLVEDIYSNSAFYNK